MFYPKKHTQPNMTILCYNKRSILSLSHGLDGGGGYQCYNKCHQTFFTTGLFSACCNPWNLLIHFNSLK